MAKADEAAAQAEEREAREPLLSSSTAAEPATEPGEAAEPGQVPGGPGAPQDPTTTSAPLAMVEQQEEQLHRQESSSGPRVEAWTADVAPALALGTALPGALPVGATTGWGAGAPLPQQPPSHSTAASARERAAADAFLAAAMGVWQPHAEWERLRPTLAAWLVASVINFVILTRAAFNGFLLAIISAVLGFTASLRVALPSCREGIDELTLAKQTNASAGIAMALNLVTLFITETALLVLALSPCGPDAPHGGAGPHGGHDLRPPQEVQEECSSLRAAAAMAAFVFALLLGTHGALSARVAQRTQVIIQMLNPVTHGRVELGHHGGW